MGIDASKSAIRLRSYLRAKREQFRRMICEGLERRDLMAVFAPGTDESYRAAWEDYFHQRSGGSLGGGGALGINLLGSRWTNPTGGPSPNMGDPARISWSIVPDGTRVGPDSSSLQSSNLIAFMDGLYGTAPGPVGNRPWFKLIKQAYDNWSGLTGVQFVYEPNDDGADYSNTARGVTGVRGDVRIGGNRIDGNFGVLAYNFTPNSGGNSGWDGDMVIDTNDIFYANNSNGPNGENRGLINVLMHESGHGLGLGHVLPVNGTKLMEPNLSLAYLGAQHDDIIGSQTLYGDDYEHNDTNATATNLGTRGNGTIQLNNVSVDRNADADVYRFTIANSGNLAINLSPDGQQYLVGPEGGSATTTDSTRYKDLSFVVEQVGGGVLATVNATGLGASEAIANLALPSEGSYLVRVLGTGSETQLYNLRLTLSGISTSSGGPVDTFRLLSIAPNATEIFSNTRSNVLSESPRELVFRFDADLDRSSLRQGIRIRPAGADKQFTAADSPITPAFLDFGESNRIVIARFSEPLPDDLYQVEVFGVDIPSEGVLAIRNQAGTQMKPRIEGADRDTLVFNLELGSRITAVVPQPVTRNASGVLIQNRDQIEVYFDQADRMYASNVATGQVTPDPTVVNPSFYQLYADRGTVTNTDDVLFVPSRVDYFVDRNMVVLTFPRNIDQLDTTNDTSFRLRIGTNESRPVAPSVLAPAADPSSAFAGAVSLGTFSTFTSIEVREQIINSTPFPLDFPGAPDTPGAREVDDDPSGGESHFLSDVPDTGVGLLVQYYNFNKIDPVGQDANGQLVFNSITPAQEQRAREIFEFYGNLLGIDFVETGSLGFRIATANIDGPGGTLGLAGGSLARMDASETWWDGIGASDDPAKTSWFTVAMHEIGHLLGLGHATELPPGANMGGAYSYNTLGGEPAWLTSSPVEPIFPGPADVTNLRYLHRPDSRDIDMYSFVVAPGQTGEFTAEVLAERQLNSSLLDSVLTLYKQNSDGSRTVISTNDDYFSEDAYIKLRLEPGTYFLGVTASGNRDINPEITDSGLNGTSEGAYRIRTSFRPLEASTITDVAGTPLDGDNNGLAGGLYNFWFQAAAPNGEQTTQRRTLLVDKQTGSSTGNGSRTNPFLTIQSAFNAAQPGDIVRLVANGGSDGNILTTSDNRAYEIGSGGLNNQSLSDGRTMEVPKGVTVMIDPGVLVKVGRTAIGVGSSTTSDDRSQAGLQVLGTPEMNVLFTSYTDESLGIDTDSLPTTPQPGDWGGLMFRNALDRAEGRLDAELEGRFVNYVSNADMRYGGGRVNIDGNNVVVTPIHMVLARPTIAFNKISRSAAAAISADSNSFEETTFTTYQYQSDASFTPDYTRIGPALYGNTVINNSINGLFVRVETVYGQPDASQKNTGRWDDRDIVHFLSDTLTIDGTPGGPFLEQTAPASGVINLATGGNVAGGVLVPSRSYRYRLTFVDTNGNESIPSAPTLSFTVPAGANAIRLSNLPSAGTGFVARRFYRSDDGGVTYRLVAELDRSSTSFVDAAAQRGTLLASVTQLNRARLDASLTIDPGMIVKVQNSRIVAGIGAQFVAEGSESRPIIMTSRQDDRYGTGGTFDTNNDGNTSNPLAGDWGGIYFSQMSSGSIDSVVLTYAGGITSIAGSFAGFNAIEIHQAEVRIANSIVERNASGTGGVPSPNRYGAGFNTPAAIFVRGAQPIILDNTIRNNTAPAISIDPGSLSGNFVRDIGRFSGLADRYDAITENKGPLVRGNSLGGNSINGMVIRGGVLNTESVWDDTDIVHVVQSEIVVPDMYVFGGLRLQSSPNESLVVKFGPGAGLTSNGRPLEIDDRIGGVLQVIGTPGFPVILTSVADDTAGAGFDPDGRAQLDTNNDGGASTPRPGDWRSLRIAEFSHDRNVATLVELEPAQSTGTGVNGTPSTAQSLGVLAASEKSSDDVNRLGFTIFGTVNNLNDLDVYSFRGTAGTTVWFDIDRTNISLDATLELIDANGNIIAQSDNSLDESSGTLALYSNPVAIDGRFVNSMQTTPFSPRNGGSGPATLTNSFADFYTTNPLDPGMRVQLPGTAGSTNTYFVRVRSSNIDSRLPGVNRSDLQAPAKVLDGKSEGQYQLQIRLREMDEFGGASISLADVRYAVNGIEVLGMPIHSPLVGEATELTTNNNVIANALDLGNIANVDRAAVSVAGDLNSPQDVDWYRFTINQVSLQDSGLVQHLSTMIDMDYADGLSRANTTLWLFYDDQNGLGGGTGIRLVAFGTDSNIADDVGAPTRGSNVDDLSRGSAGILDAFLGNIELPSGNYFLAITSNEQTSSYMSQFYSANAGGNPLTRVEPVNSVRRIVEDRFGGSTTSTAAGPLQVGVQRGSASAVPYTLADVVLFVSQQAPGSDTSELITINPLTGQQISLVSRFPFVQDVTMRGDGTVHGSRTPLGVVVNDANSGGILTVDAAGNGTTSGTATSGIQTFEYDLSVTPPAVAQALTPGAGTTRAGRGMAFLGLTYPQVGSTQFLYAAGSRVGATTFIATPTGGTRDAQNYIYKLDPSSLQAVSSPQSDRTDNARVSGAGTQIVERGYVDTSRDAGARNSTSQTIEMSAASSTTTPALLSGDLVRLQGSDGNTYTFEWTANQLSATLIADTLPQTSASNPNAATPTNFFRDGMNFTITAGTNTRTFEIDTGRVLVNNYATLATPPTYDGYTFVIEDLTSPTAVRTTYEFDNNNALTNAANVRIVYDATNSTQFQVSQAIVSAINGVTTSTARAFLLPGTNRISISGDALLIPGTESGNVRSPILVTQLTNNFPTLTPTQTYDGATFTIVSRTGTTRTFEFDSNGSVAGTNIPVAYDSTSTQQFITQSIDAAINQTAANSGGTWDVQSFFTTGSNVLRILGDATFTLSPSTATVINPLALNAQSGRAVSNSGNILVPIEEYFTNLANTQLFPNPSTPGAITTLISSINTAAFGVTASNIGTRLILAGATGGNFQNIPTMSFNVPTSTGIPLPFGFNDSAATLNQTLFNAIRNVEPQAKQVTNGRIWLPATASFIQSGTDDRGDTPSKNAQLSLPSYGRVTGLAFAGTAMFGVSDQGDLYRIGGAAFNPDSANNNGDFIETIYNTTTGQRVQFSSLVAGPRNAESSLQFTTLDTGLDQILFGIDTGGILYAFDTLGRPAHIFPDAQWFIQTSTNNPSGLAFSNLDVNLWHETGNNRDNDDGHGVNVAFDGSRRTQENGGNSLYFGFENPNDANRQPGNWAGVNNPIGGFPGYDAARENTYDFPGGAKGSVISDPINLSNYSPADKPYLYFNYYLQTENANANNPGDSNFMKDAFRVFASEPNGTWRLLATNNSDYDASRLTGQRDEFDYPFEEDIPRALAGLPLQALNRQVSELFDAGAAFNGQTAPNNWRQARIDLSRFAGQKDLRLRFDFSTAGSAVIAQGGTELVAIAGSEMPLSAAQRRFTISGTPNVQFEFDFGLLLQVPSGGRITNGDQFQVDGITFTFSLLNNTGNNVLFAATESAETIAARIAAKLTPTGLNAVIDPVTPSLISISNATNSNPIVSPTLPASFIADVPGVAAGNEPIVISRGMTAAQVRDEIRKAFARRLNAAGQETNVNAVRFNGNSIYLWNRTVVNRGPLLNPPTLQGDEFGERNSTQFTNTVGQGAQRGQSNRFEGVYIDDIIVGFAERGEMVTYQNNATASVTTFLKNPRHEPATGYEEIETGTYQFEIRRGATYGLGGRNFPSLSLIQSFDTNDRLGQFTSLVAPRGSQIADGQIFQISNGNITVIYEYDDTSITSGPNAGVTQGRVRVPFTSFDTSITIAQSIRDAINSAESRALIDISAGISDGTATGSVYNEKASGSRVVHLHGRVAANNSGGLFSGTRSGSIATANAPGYILYGIDAPFGNGGNPASFRFYEDGDKNRERDQGQILVQGNIVRDTSGWGIFVDAGARINSVLTPLAGILPHPGSVRNLLQFNQADLIPGTVVMNNLVYSAAVGGILFSGDQRSTATIEAPVPFGRIINNSVIGLNGSGIGISVTDNASPTLINNIVASSSIGINVDATSSTTVIAATTFRGNGNNVVGTTGGTFPQFLSISDPLFVNAAARNYYLASGSLAIDSSIDRLDDRNAMTSVRTPLGIAPSPILAPDIDLTGQLRVDDPFVSNPNGTGSNPFKDRGAYDRADFIGPVSIIQAPIDNDPDNVDVDRSTSFIRLNSGNLEFFSILLYEPEGTGPDASTVTADSVTVSENGRMLRTGVDYIFGYSPSSRTIRLTPLSGFWRQDSVYEVTLINQPSFRLNVPRGSAVTDGQQIRLSVGTSQYVLEFDTGDGVTGTAVPIPYKTNYTETMMAVALLKALGANNITAAGINTVSLARDVLLLTGISGVAFTPTSTAFTSFPLGGIADLAGNRLQPNRQNAMTQYTIAMPEVSIDYGDGMQRSTSTSNTLLSDNGSRHAMFPTDEPLLVLGQYADSDSDGIPSPAADADDNDSSILFSAGMPFTFSSNGPARVTTLANAPALVGKSITITDDVNNKVVFRFKDNSLTVAPPEIAVDIQNAVTSSDVAEALRAAIYSQAILPGRLFGITAIRSGNILTLGGSSSHTFDLSGSGGFVIRDNTGNLSINVAKTNGVNNLADGQTVTVQDGSGNTVVFQIIDTSLASPSTPSGGNVGVFVNLSTSTADQVATALSAAMNSAISARRLLLPATTVNSSIVRVLANDEDGVRFGGYFNPFTPAVVTTITSSGPGFVDAWIDWNQDNDFNDPGEQMLKSQPVFGGANNFSFTTPTGAVVGYTTARFRLSATGGLTTTGLAIGGEVEDYAIEILPGAPPVAVDDPSSSKAAKYRVNEDSVLTVVAADGVLSNDIDIDSPTFTVFDTDPNTPGVQPTVGTQNGTLVLQLDGSFVYTPNPNFFGTDTFTYQVTDPRMVGNRPATVTLTVSPINDTPLANADSITINEDTPQVWNGSLFTSNDFGGATAGGQAIPNEASQNLRIVGVQLVNASGNPITPRVGESLMLSNNVINYTPGSNYNSLIGGNVFIRMVVEDDGVSYSTSSNSNIADPKQSISTLTVTIDPVNDRPTFTIPNNTINLTEDPGSQTLVNFVTNVLAGPIADTPNGIGPADDELGNVAGVPGQNVTFAVRAINPASFTTAGQPAIVRNGTNGTLTFTLAPDVNSVNSGPILVEIIAQDGTPLVPSIPQTITINVAQVNDPPVFETAFSTITIDEDAPLQVFPRFYFNLAPGPATAIDEAGQTLTTTVVAATPQYFLTQPRISAAGDFEFQLAPDVNSLFSGSLNVLITLTDSGTPNASLTRTITIVANDINDAPLLALNTTNINVREDETTLTGVTPTSVKGLVASLSQGPLTALDELGNFAPTVPGQVMSFSLISVSNPTLFSQAPAIDGAGTLTFVTAPNRNGSAAVVMRLTDNGRASPAPNSNVGPTVTFTISVAAINDAPEFSIPSSLDVVEDQGVVSVPGFATGIRPGPETAFDESRQTLSFNLVQFDPNLFEIAPSLQSDGTLSFKTRLDINSNTPGISRVVAFQLQDGGVSEPPPNTNLSVIRSFTLNVTPVNDPPIPGAFVQPGTEDFPLTILAANVEQVGRPGPIDEEVVEGQQIRMTQIERTSERGGLVVPIFSGDRIVSIQYTPPSNFVGDDTIRYVLTDSGSPERSATGSIVVRVTGVNDAPQFTPGPDLNVLEDSAPYNAPWATNILAGPINAPDEWSGPDAQTVSFQVTANNPAFFAVQPAIDAAGVLSFTLAKDVNGVVTVDVTAIDNGASQPPNVNTSTTHRLSIVVGAVNDPPGYVLGGNISRDEDSGPFVSANPFVTKIVGAEGMNNTPPTGTDEAGQSVALLTTNSNNALFSVQPAIDSTGRLTFTPAPDASGLVEVYVVGVDNGPSTAPNVNRSQRQTFTIELKPLNDAPFAVNDRYATSEDDLLSIAAAGVLANDRDVDLPNDTLQVVVPPSGTLTSTLGAIVVLNADGSFTYDPRGSAQLQRLTIGESVVDTFTYTIRDLAGALSNLGTVSITVSGINDNPVAVNDSFRVAAGLPTLLDVLANDTDIDSSIDVRTVEIGRIPSNGRVIVLPTGRVEYTPTAGFVGQDSFTYRFRDSLGAPSNEATVVVNSSNPPVAVDDTFTVVRNTPTVIDVLRNDFDPDQGGALDRATLTIASGPDVGTAVILADGTIRYTPSTGFSGTATFQYFVSDTTGQPSNLARVTLNVVNSLHQNPVNKMDVNDDGFVSPIDVLFIVNDINFNGFRPLPDSFGRPPYLDVNGNGGTDALDVLEIINFINSVGSGGAGEGEASNVTTLMSTQVDVEIMSPQAFVELRQREEKLTLDVLQELTLAAVLKEDSEFGPALPLASLFDKEESLADYLARWRTVGSIDEESSDLDRIFSGDAWL